MKYRCVVIYSCLAWANRTDTMKTTGLFCVYDAWVKRTIAWFALTQILNPEDVKQFKKVTDLTLSGCICLIIASPQEFKALFKVLLVPTNWVLRA